MMILLLQKHLVIALLFLFQVELFPPLHNYHLSSDTIALIAANPTVTTNTVAIIKAFHD
jgi:hypothetical protein